MLTIDFFHDTVCCWCYNISARMRGLATEFDLDIRHRTFVLQASKQEMAERWGHPGQAKATILGHWKTCRRTSDRPDMVNIDAMARAPFDYPHGMEAALACKAAQEVAGQAGHWDMFDRIQRAHLSEAQNIADPAVLARLAGKAGFDPIRIARLMRDPAIAIAVEADRQRARRMQVHAIPALIVRETGTRLINGPLGDLRAQLRAAQRLAA